MPCSSWSSTAHSDITRQPRASTEKLDSPRQQLDAPAHGVSLDRLDRNSTGSTRLDRQGLDNGLDNGSTEPRQLDSSTARAQTFRTRLTSSSSTGRVCDTTAGGGGDSSRLRPFAGVRQSYRAPGPPSLHVLLHATRGTSLRFPRLKHPRPRPGAGPGPRPAQRARRAPPAAPHRGRTRSPGTRGPARNLLDDFPD